MNRSLLLRCLSFLACIPSGGALLLKVWGLTPMAWGGALFLACLPVLVSTFLWSRHHDPLLARALKLGFWGGLLGTIGYDVVRIPFHLLGFKVFAPIEAYGVWLLEANRSSGWSDSLGWLYHFSNGITFGLMYALVMGGRHWGWGVLWGLCLESIVLASPFARMFHMQGNWPAIAMAYGAHIAYGFPLGYLVYRWEVAEDFLSTLRTPIKGGLLLLLVTFLAAWVPASTDRDARALPGTLMAEGPRLNPTWVRLRSIGTVQVANSGANSITLIQPSGKRKLEIPAGTTQAWEFSEPGIYQCYLQTDQRSISSFVIVEPAERCP